MSGSDRDRPARTGAGRRLRALIRKETLQVLRDPSSIAIALVMPVALLFLFGYGVSLDAENVPIAVVVEDLDPAAAEFAARFELSRYFSVRRFTAFPEAEEALRSGEVDGIVRLRSDFSRNLHRRQLSASVQVIADGVDANRARLVTGYVNKTWRVWLDQRAGRSAEETPMAVRLEPRVWFNQELRSQNYIVPGLIALNMTLIGALLTALVMAREWERGTLEALLVTPVRITEILLGKLIPYFALGLGGMALSVLLAVGLFDVPLRGSLLVLLAASSLFLLVALGMGLLISSLTRNQFVAGQLAIITTFLPAFILSGIIFDIGSMPVPIQLLTRLVAARYFVSILTSLFLAGDVSAVFLPNMLALSIMAFVFLGAARKLTGERLE